VVPVVVNSIAIGIRRAIIGRVAGIANVVVVDIGLSRVGNIGAVIAAVAAAITIGILVPRVVITFIAYTIIVTVGLPIVVMVRAVVEAVKDSIVICVLVKNQDVDTEGHGSFITPPVISLNTESDGMTPFT